MSALLLRFARCSPFERLRGGESVAFEAGLLDVLLDRLRRLVVLRFSPRRLSDESGALLGRRLAENRSPSVFSPFRFALRYRARRAHLHHPWRADVCQRAGLGLRTERVGLTAGDRGSRDPEPQFYGSWPPTLT